MSYAQQLASARTAHELNELADRISRDRDLPPDERKLLQASFARRCRELWPHRMVRR